MTTCVSTFTAVQYMPRLETIESCMKLSQMLIQAVDVRSSPLLQLPHITQDMLKHFTTKKVGLNTSPIKRYTFKNTSPQKKVHACLKTQNEIHSNNTPQGLNNVLKYYTTNLKLPHWFVIKLIE